MTNEDFETRQQCSRHDVYLLDKGEKPNPRPSLQFGRISLRYAAHAQPSSTGPFIHGIDLLKAVMPLDTHRQ